MTPRDILFGLVGLAILGLIGVVCFADDAPVQVGPIEESPATGFAPPESQQGTPAPDQGTTAIAPPEAVRGGDPIDPDRNSGEIRGQVILTSDVVDKLRTMYVQVREATTDDNAAAFEARYGRRRYDQTAKVEYEPGAGSPQFLFSEVPFSQLGYKVWVFAEGFNGSDELVHVTPERPTAGAQLLVRKLTPFSVRLVDQERNPVKNMAVLMVPEGEPLGRKIEHQSTDQMGAAIFAGVPRGHYRIYAHSRTQPKNDPKESLVQVMPTGGLRSTVVEVPSGWDQLVIVQPPGWKAPTGKVWCYRTDTTRWQKYEEPIDRLGRVTFKHLTPGEYLLNVEADGYGPRTRSFKIAAHQRPSDIRVKLR